MVSVFHKLRNLRVFVFTLLVFVGLVGLLSFRSPVFAVSANLVTNNPGFENNNFTGWNGNSGWSVQTTKKHSGSYAAYCSYNGSNCSTSFNTAGYTVTAGHSINFSVWGYMTNTSSTITLTPIWMLSSGSTLSDPDDVIDSSGSWQQLSINQVAPANAIGLKIKITISDVNGGYYIDDAEIYDYYPEFLPSEYFDMNDDPGTQITTEGVDTSSEQAKTAWLDSGSVKKQKVNTLVFLDADEDKNYDLGEQVVSGITVTQKRCTHTGKPCVYADFGSGKTGTTNSSGIMTVKWVLDTTAGQMVMQETTPGSYYCVANDCSSKHIIKRQGFNLKQGFLLPVSGILRVQTVSTCNTQFNDTNQDECYKVLTPDGNDRWILRDTGVFSNASLFTANEGKRVTITGPFVSGFTAAYSPRLAKTLVSTDFAIKYGLGGGDISTITGSSTIQSDLSNPTVYASAEWANIEPNGPDGNGNHTYNWTYSGYQNSDLYKAMEYCHSKALTSCQVAIIYGPSIPSWAKQGGTAMVCGDDNGNYVSDAHLSDLASFAGALVSHINSVYGSSMVQSYSLYNEPDNGLAGANCTVDNYKTQYEAVATAVHTNGGKIAAGGFAIENGANGNTTDLHSTNWVAGFFSQVNPSLVDYINIHWYELYKGYPEFCTSWNGGACNHANDFSWTTFDSYSQGGGGVRGKLNWLRGVLAVNGIFGKPIVLGEIGDSQDRNHDTTQAENLFKELAQVYSTDLPMSSVMWFKLVGSANDGFGDLSLIYGGQNRASYTAYRAIAGELLGSKFSRIDTANSNIEGYIFTESGGSEKEVLWSRSGTQTKTFPGSTVRKITTGNTVTTISATNVSIGTSPIIIDY